MSKIDAWLSKHDLKSKRALIAAIAFVIFIICLFLLLNTNDKDTENLTVTENAELRTGPNAAYPIIQRVDKGDHLKKIGQTGKWIEVKDKSDDAKGWIAGWHTNLDIAADNAQQQNVLKDKTIVLDPGHGGSDQGASSNTQYKSLEKTYTLKTANELKQLLEKEGAKVKMTRTDDSYVSLDDRDIKGDAYISIHNDSLDSSKANGATVYWYRNNQQTLAETLDSHLEKKGLLTNRGVRQENFQVLRQTNIPAVLLELGYISNPTDETMIRDQLHREIVEHAIVDGLKQYFSA